MAKTPKTPLSDAARIKRLADKYAGDGWRFRSGYSGRGMFGRQCVGIECPPKARQHVEAAVKRIGIKCEARGDSMGLDEIVYWPGVSPDPTLAEDYAAKRTAIGDDPDELFDEAEAEGGIFGRNE